MKSRVDLIIAMIASAAVSFYVVQKWDDPITKDANLLPTLIDALSMRRECTVQDDAQCESYIAWLKSAIPQAPFDLKLQSTFDVYVSGAKMVFYKSPCNHSDVAEPDFTWVVYPLDEELLTPERKRRGYLEGVVKFDDAGILGKETCVLLVSLPTDAYRRIEAGQYLSIEGKWKWVVTHSN